MKILVLGLVAVLAACGGGDSGLMSSVTVNGVASKGLLLQAKVQAFEIQPDGRESPVPLATAITNDQGEYSLTGLPSGANLVLRVSKNDSSSMMLDEASGKKVSLDTSLVLSHLIQTTAQSAIEAHITPFSEAAYARARVMGLASDKIATNMTEARQLIESQMGINLAQKPHFSEGVNPLNDMAKKLVTFSKAVKSNPCGCSQADVSGQTQCMVDVMVGNAQKGDLKFFSEWVNSVAPESYSKASAVSSRPEILSGVMTQAVDRGGSSRMFTYATTSKTMTARTAVTQSGGSIGMGSKSSFNRNLIRVSTSATLPSSGSNLSVNGNVTTTTANATVNGLTNATLPSSGSNLSVNGNVTTTTANATVNGSTNATLSGGSNVVGTSTNQTAQSLSSICPIKPSSGTLTLQSL